MSIGRKVQETIIPTNVSPFNYMQGSYSFFYSYVNSSDINNVIQSFKSKSCGSQYVPVRVLKLISDIISPIIAELINRCFVSGEFPQCLKVAQITPIYKDGDHTNTENYRPISVLPTIAKIFKKVIYKQLYNYIETFNILKDCQYGFRNKMSTQLAIVSHLTYLYKS